MNYFIKLLWLNLTLTHWVIVIISLFIFVILTTIFVLFYSYKSKEINKAIDDVNNLSHLMIDIFNKKITYFNTVKLDEKIETSIDNFLNRFSQKNKVLISRWLLNLLNPNILTSAYLEIKDTSRRSKASCLYLFHCCEVKPEKNLIHIDLYSSNQYEKRMHDSYYIKSEDEIDRSFYRLKKNSTVSIGLISFYPKARVITKNGYKIDKILQRRIIDLILKKLSKNRFITILKNGEIVIVSINKISSDKTFFENLEKEISRFYTTNDLDNRSFNLCLMVNTGNKLNFKICLKKLKDLSNYQILSRQEDKHFFLYNPQETFEEPLQNILIEETKRIMERKNFIIAYTPFINIASTIIDNYYFDIKPASELFEDKYLFYECLHNANLTLDYLNHIIDIITYDFEDESTTKGKRTSKDIAIEISPLFLESLLAIKERLTSLKEYKFNFIIKCDDINNYYLKTKNSVEILDSLFNASNINLWIKVFKPVLPTKKIIDLTQAFIISNIYYRDCIQEYKNKVLYSNLFKKINAYNKLIYFYNVPDFTSLETLLCQNIYYFAGPFLNSEEEINPTISKRISAKLKDLYLKYY